MRPLYQNFIEQSRKVNWMLLLFLLLFLNVKMAVKIAAVIVFLVIYRKEILSNNFLKQKYIWFYGSMIAIAVLNLMINVRSLSVNYLVAATTGIGFWLLCIVAAAICFRFIHKNDTGKLHATVSLFFIFNALFTIVQLMTFMLDAGSINPYTYQGMNQKYFIGTGDLLRGITLDVSTTNAVLNAMAVIYFLDRRRIHWLLLCMAALLLTASNFTNLLLFATLFFQFIFQSDRNQKSVIIVCLCMLVIFFSKISPQNKNYLKYVWQKVSDRKIDSILPESTPPLLSTRPDSILDREGKRRKFAMLYLDSVYTSNHSLIPVKNIEINQPAMSTISSHALAKPSIPKPNIHTEPYQRKKDTSSYRKHLIDFAITNIRVFDTSLRNTQKQKMPGKLIALKQTAKYLREHHEKLFAGTGIGKFSSKLAFRATGLQFAGGYPAGFNYIGNDFRDNHLNLYLNYFSKDKELHSLMNSPDSVYDQLLAEYGIAGILAFLLLYAVYFVKHRRRRSYSLPLLLLMAGSFFIGYWFEQLSVVILFEFLMLVDSKEAKENV